MEEFAWLSLPNRLRKIKAKPNSKIKNWPGDEASVEKGRTGFGSMKSRVIIL